MNQDFTSPNPKPLFHGYDFKIHFPKELLT